MIGDNHKRSARGQVLQSGDRQPMVNPQVSASRKTPTALKSMVQHPGLTLQTPEPVVRLEPLVSRGSVLPRIHLASRNDPHRFAHSNSTKILDVMKQRGTHKK